jgi:hypothetical protein
MNPERAATERLRTPLRGEVGHLKVLYARPPTCRSDYRGGFGSNEDRRVALDVSKRPERSKYNIAHVIV